MDSRKLRGLIKLVAICWSLLFSINNSLAMPTPLTADQAFRLAIVRATPHRIILHWQIAPGYHLYRNRIQFALQEASSGNIGNWQLPNGVSVHDNILGNYQIYRRQLTVNLPLKDVRQSTINLIVHYQGCSEANFCYPPVTKLLQINFKNPIANKTILVASSQNWQDQVTHILHQKNYVLIVLTFLGFGLLLALTPCVLPMIPILSGIIVGQNLTARRAFLVSFSYVLGMSLAYAFAGMLTALAGSRLTAYLQMPAVIMAFSGLFILLALSLFGLYELRLPQFLHQRVTGLSNRQRRGSLTGAFIMGALSILIVSPCVSAPLVGVLTFIGQTGDIVLGSVTLFALGFGMGMPLLVIGVTEGRFLPRTGPWMQIIKNGFGLLLIALAIHLLQRVLAPFIIWYLWGILLLFLAVYLISPSSGWQKFKQGLGLSCFIYSIVLIFNATHTWQPLPANPATTSSFKRITTLAAMQQAINQAAQAHKMVMVDFYANWCTSCQTMATDTFANSQVKSALQNMVLLQADVSENNADSQLLQNYFHVIAPPTVLFFNCDGQELANLRIVGALSWQSFLPVINRAQASCNSAINKYNGNFSFKDFS